MLPVLSGNHDLIASLERMASGARLPQCFLFYGESGLGKKSLAHWFAARLLCTGAAAPCGTCKSCRTIASGSHPDVIEVPHSGKLGGFSVETVRKVCGEALVAPNEGARKVYLFTDCDAMDVRAQNILLKLIEEPPAFAYFLFTASAKQVLLPTILSRLVPLAVSPCTEAEAAAVLRAKGCCSEAEISEAVRCFHGNVGNCLAYLQDPSCKALVGRVQESVQSLLHREEYGLLRTFFAVGSDRETARRLLLLLDAVVRDAIALRLDPELSCIGCDPDGARALAERISSGTARRWHTAIGNAWKALSANVNVQLLLSALCAELLQSK